jgi:hypothetical protein
VITELLAEFPALLLVLHTGPRVFPLDDRIIAAPAAGGGNLGPPLQQRDAAGITEQFLRSRS